MVDADEESPILAVVSALRAAADIVGRNIANLPGATTVAKTRTLERENRAFELRAFAKRLEEAYDDEVIPLASDADAANTALDRANDFAARQYDLIRRLADRLEELEGNKNTPLLVEARMDAWRFKDEPDPATGPSDPPTLRPSDQP